MSAYTGWYRIKIYMFIERTLIAEARFDISRVSYRIFYWERRGGGGGGDVS